ncbi:MAG: InlB B-repeat-containing protein [Thermoplasmata archaeon]
MFPHGGRSTGTLGGSRLVVGLMVLLAVLIVVGLVAPSLAQAPSVSSGASTATTPTPHAAATPSAAAPPEIFYYYASPPMFDIGGYTFIEFYAYSPQGDPLNYAMTGLPTGCSFFGSTFTFCYPTAAGAFNMTLTVTDPVTLQQATSQTSIFVLPELAGTFFTVNPDVIHTFPVSISEYGLPYGMSWSVTINGDNVTSTSSTIQFVETDGSYSYSVGGISGYAASPQFGSVVVDGAGASTFVSFYPTTSGTPVTFSETGLSTGTSWSILLGSYEIDSTSSSMTLYVPAGVYSYSVGLVSHEAATPANGTVFAFGSASVSISFTPYPITVYPITISENGLAFGALWTVTLNGTLYVLSSSSFSVNYPDGHYAYSIGAIPGYTPSTTHGHLTVSGGSTSLTVVFTPLPPPPTFPLTFSESGLAVGTSWTVYVGGGGYTANSPSIIVDLTNGSYQYSIGSSPVSVANYTVAPANGFVNVLGAAAYVNVTYSPAITLAPGTAGCAPSSSSPPFYTNNCYPEAFSPTLLSLEGGSVTGLASQIYTNVTANTCPGVASITNSRIGFQTSSDEASSFSAALSLGNDSSCQYPNAIEPSFASSGSNVYGAFIEENSSNLSFNYGDRAGDALGFVASTDNGTNFSSAVTIDPSGNLARPVVGAFGSTVYIIYENIANSSTAIGGGVLPISLEFVWSNQNGTYGTWNGPTTLPGEGASQGYNAMNPSIAVSPNGTVAVAYATDRTCEYSNSSGCAAFSDSIVVVTSYDNGTSWAGPNLVTTGAGESTCFTGSCLSYFFQSTPQTALSYDPASGYLYVAYAADYDQGIGASSQNFNHTGIFAEYSADGGATWAGGAVVAPSGDSSIRSFNPGLGVSSQGVYLTYLQANESAGSFGLANSLSQWVVTSAPGVPLAWASPTVIDIDSFAISGGAVNTTEASFGGYSSNVAFDSFGNPWVAFSLPAAPATTISSGTGYYYVNSTFPTSLIVGSLAVPGAANTVEVNFTAGGLPAGTPWTFYINGVSYLLDVPSITFTNIPLGATMLVGAYYVPEGQWTIVSNWYNATTMSFDFNQTYTFEYTVLVGYEFNFFPSNTGFWTIYGDLYMFADVFVFSPSFFYAYIDIEDFGNFEDIFSESSLQVDNFDEFCTGQCPWTNPFYFPIGTQVQWQIQDYPYESLPILYFTGTGAGSYTGPVQGECDYYYEGFCEESIEFLNLVMNSAITETFWLGDGPVSLTSSVSFSAPTLPSNSTFYATVNGTVVSGTAASPGVLPNVAPGAYAVSNIWATSWQPGWEYFGTATGPNPFVAPVETNVVLSFGAYVNLSAAPGQVTFYAPAIATGTTWSLTFNETTYTSTTPWINVTTRPGTFDYSVGNAVAPDGTAGYLPTTPSGSISVLPGTTYPIAYTPAYQVVVEASTGGLVSADHSSQTTIFKTFVASGSSVPISEAPLAGYTFAGWAGSGSGSYSGTLSSTTLTVTSPVVESASYLPLPGARFNLTFNELGLAAGTWWTVNLDGIGYSSDASSMTVSGLYSWSSGTQGHYNLTVPTSYSNSTNLTRFVVPPGTYPGTVGVNATLTAPVTILFVPQVQVALTYSGDGTVETTYNGAPSGATVWANEGSQVTISAAAYPGWTFAGWQGTGSGSYSGANATESITAAGPVSEVALFNPVAVTHAATYSATFSLGSPLAPGTSWGVTLGGVGYTTTASTLTVSNISSATYAMQVSTATAPSGLVQYRPTSSDPVAITVNHNESITVSYVSYYFVSVSASVGGTVTPAPGWYASGSVLYLVATANSTDTFLSWTGTGAGSYTGPNATAALIVGAPVTEVASFGSTGVGAAAASIWSNPTTWLGLGGAALVIGIVVGVVFARLGTRTSSPGAGSSPARPPNPPAGGGTP